MEVIRVGSCQLHHFIDFHIFQVSNTQCSSTHDAGSYPEDGI